jgi:probable FeS assembly SUF system protein SufT
MKVMSSYEVVILSRAVDAYVVPSGARFHLVAGTEVTITQDRGDNFTVNIYGNLFRIDGKDADALGRTVDTVPEELPLDVDFESYVWSQLKTCYDPEIPVNIVDLGLIYECNIVELAENQRQVNIKMTLTAPGCGMGPVLVADVTQKVLAIPSIVEANVELVFDPPWDRSKISDVAKLELGIF